jgi:UDP-N-acetylmuramate: L-alanyl-gamma-D-glutamyl-meso-diaminopimelate ligase
MPGRVHFVGVSGTGMGSLATLFREAGHEVTGSDARFDPPMGDVLRTAGVTCLTGFDAARHEPAPDLVVVGNAIRKENLEAASALERGLPRTSMSKALRDFFLAKRRPLVVCGTHGKTTTSSMCAWILLRAEANPGGRGVSPRGDPGYFIGGVSKNLPRSAAIGFAARSLTAGAGAPFVVEGDEYDAVYWHKEPKFYDYVGASDNDVVILTGVEHDHIDIYPTAAAYEAAFEGLMTRLPPGGLLVCDASDARARAVARGAPCRVAYYALDGDDTGDVTPTWLGAPAPFDDLGRQPFDLFAGGVSGGRFLLTVPGRHNVRNALGALAACAEGFGVSIGVARTALSSFEGVRRRQDLLGTPSGVFVYDDFAHHPTAVSETLRALREKHPQGTLWAVFEPRSATACRALHQEAYAAAFEAATRVLLAPLGRTNVAEGERLDLEKLARDVGPKAEAAPSTDAIQEQLVREVRTGDTVVLLSNGAFEGLPRRVLSSLAERDAARAAGIGAT